MDNNIEHAEKAIACCGKMKEGLRELIALFDISNDTFGEMDRLETYKSIGRTIDKWREQYADFLAENAESFEQSM